VRTKQPEYLYVKLKINIMKLSNLQIALDKIRSIKSLNHDERIILIDAMGDLAQSQYEKGSDAVLEVYGKR
tara:strand:+ start:84 stop:296 length:213 start_codon:yes stop_codon:yes gene_type:complete